MKPLPNTPNHDAKNAPSSPEAARRPVPSKAVPSLPPGTILRVRSFLVDRRGE